MKKVITPISIEATCACGRVAKLTPATSASMLVAMERRIVEEKLQMICPEGLLVHDCEEDKRLDEEGPYRLVQVAATGTARRAIGDPRCANAVVLGVLAQLLDVVELDVVRDIVRKFFPAPQVNLQALEAGIALMESHAPVK